MRFRSISPDISRRKDSIQAKAEKIIGTSWFKPDFAASVEFSSNIVILENILRDAFVEKGSPITVLFDISCMPKMYILFLLGSGFRREYVSAFDLVYSEGKYEFKESLTFGSRKDGIISSGDWTSVQIPYLEAKEYVPDRRDLFISLGAEISGALPLISRFEPRKLKVFEIEQGPQRVPTEVLERENHAFQTLMGLPNTESKRFNLEDVAGVFSDILQGCEGATTCLAIGSKPHAVALGLAALASDTIEVVCRIPSTYTATEVEPLGTIHRFLIRDRFEPGSYL